MAFLWLWAIFAQLTHWTHDWWRCHWTGGGESSRGDFTYLLSVNRGSDQRSVWGIHIPYVFPMKNEELFGATWSFPTIWYFEHWSFTNDFIAVVGLDLTPRNTDTRLTSLWDIIGHNEHGIPSGHQTWQWKLPELNGGFRRKITDTWSIFRCHVWLPKGT